MMAKVETVVNRFFNNFDFFGYIFIFLNSLLTQSNDEIIKLKFKNEFKNLNLIEISKNREISKNQNVEKLLDKIFIFLKD